MSHRFNSIDDLFDNLDKFVAQFKLAVASSGVDIKNSKFNILMECIEFQDKKFEKVVQDRINAVSRRVN